MPNNFVFCTWIKNTGKGQTYDQVAPGGRHWHLTGNKQPVSARVWSTTLQRQFKSQTAGRRFGGLVPKDRSSTPRLLKENTLRKCQKCKYAAPAERSSSGNIGVARRTNLSRLPPLTAR